MRIYCHVFKGYVVEPVAFPTPDEKSRHFLWRFWKRLPKDGLIAIFDRAWYGRVMVEHIKTLKIINEAIEARLKKLDDKPKKGRK